MSRIRGRDTVPEMVLRKSLHKMGFRYRVHGKLPGRPDLVFAKYRALVFVHGCFWHRHSGCAQSTSPSSNVAFWQAKFARTIERDAAVIDKLEKLDWRVAVVWECALKKDSLGRSANQISSWLNSKREFLELSGMS